MTTLDPRSRAATRGWSDITIRNLFVIPTVAFLIIFNVFPLLYSLGFSFTDFKASSKNPAHFVGLKNYIDILADPVIWRTFSTTLWYVIVSVAGQFVVGFGLALLLNRPIPGKGLLTTLLMLPMMLSPVVVGLFWKLIYDPSWGILNYALGLGKTAWLTDPSSKAATGPCPRVPTTSIAACSDSLVRTSRGSPPATRVSTSTPGVMRRASATASSVTRAPAALLWACASAAPPTTSPALRRPVACTTSRGRLRPTVPSTARRCTKLTSTCSSPFRWRCGRRTACWSATVCRRPAR